MRPIVLMAILALFITYTEAGTYSSSRVKTKKLGYSEEENFLIVISCIKCNNILISKFDPKMASTEGKLFGYMPKTNEIKWAADLKLPLISSSHRVDLMEENHPIFLPTIEGDVGVFGYNENLNRYPMDEITAALQYCPLAKNTKVFSKTEDHAFFLNPKTGEFAQILGGNFNEIFEKFGGQNDSVIIHVKSYLITAIDFVKMKEIWNVNSADIEFLTPMEYFAFRPGHPPEDKEHPKYFFLRKEGNVLEIYERADWALVSTLSLENEKIFKAFAKNSTSQTYYPIQIKGRLDFVVKSNLPSVFKESTTLALADWREERLNEHALARNIVYDNHDCNSIVLLVYGREKELAQISDYYCDGDPSNCEQHHFKIVKKSEFQSLIDCLDGIIQSRKERAYKEIETINRLALTYASNKDEEEKPTKDDEEEDDDKDKEEEDEDEEDQKTVEQPSIKANESTKNAEPNQTNVKESIHRESQPLSKLWMMIYGFSALIVAMLGITVAMYYCKRDLTPPPMVKKRSLVVHTLGPDASAMKVSADSQEPPQDSAVSEKDKKNDKKNGRVSTNEKDMKPFIVDINEYEILGHGSAGTVVFGATFQNRPVAVKRVLRTHNALALKEIEILLQVDHPNIIKYLFYQEDKEFIYLVLERCLFTLGDLIEFWESISKKNRKESRPTRRNIPSNVFAILGKPQARAAAKMRLIIECLKGIEYLHSHNIIHRDLKPDNVLVTHEGNIKLSDFAISKILDDKKMEFLTENVGSGGWRAPEILLQREKTKAVDIFALGCLFYFILSEGEHPFGEKFEREQNIIKGQTKLKLPDGDHEFDDLIKNMVCFEPKQRYTIEQIKNHPVFWSVEKKLNYMQEFSNYIESTDEKHGDAFDEMVRLQNIIPLPWERSLEAAIVKDIIKFRKYDFMSARDLIRVIRNKKSHYYELSIDTRLIIGQTPLSVYDYFAKKFPKLFLSIFSFCESRNIRLV